MRGGVVEALVAGLLVGLAVAAPLGPNAMLCIRRSLVAGSGAGLVTGLGAATAHALYAGVAIGGLGLARSVLGRAELVRPLTGLVLVGLSVRALRAGVGEIGGSGGGEASGGRAYVSTLALALANPLTIGSLAAMAGSLEASSPRPGVAALVVAGVFAGSAAWWSALATTVATLRTRLGAAHLRYLNLVCGASIGGFGVVALVRSI